jgi:hypothetical protein
MAFLVVIFSVVSVKAQYGYDGPDRYFYEDEFDWRWDVRVRISDGNRSGYLTNREANRLYRRLEDIERKEWAFTSDGHYSTWEQDEIWRDVVDLNYAIGLELTDWDRRYYGYTGVVINRPLHWYFGPSYDFYRFDKRGYGTVRLGYAPRTYYPKKHVYYNHRDNYTSHWKNYSSRVATPSRNNNARRDVSGGRNMAPDRAATSRNARPGYESNGSVRSSDSRGSVDVSRPSGRESGAMERSSSRESGSVNRSSGRESGSVERSSGRESGSVNRSSGRESGSVERSSGRESGSVNRSSGRESGSVERSSGRESGSVNRSSGRESGSVNRSSGRESVERSSSSRSSGSRTRD